MRLHLVDGTYELFRAHFSHRPDHVHGGRDLKATMGLAESMLGLLADADERVTHLAIAFDNPIRSVRNDWFRGYKTDEGVPAELLAQFDAAEEAARALGIVVWSMDRYEADDALATAAARWRDSVEQVRVLTPDKDLGQCITGQKVVLVDRMRRKVIDEQELWNKRGIRPSHVPAWLALVGDSADGIPGIAGFGEKTAAALLRAYGTLEGIPHDPRTWPSEIRQRDRLAKTLAAGMNEAVLYRKLATLITDVPLPESLDALRWQGVVQAAFDAWCASTGAREALRERVRAISVSGEGRRETPSRPMEGKTLP
jgi:5'-3' exonuclease